MAIANWGGDGEASLRKYLVDITREVEEAQARTIATLDSKHAEYVSAYDQINGLSHKVKSLAGELSNASVPEGFQSELDELKAAVATMGTMLEVQQRFNEFDKMLSSSQYSDAVQTSTDIAKSMEGIRMSTFSLEPAILKVMKMGYYQRRAVLTAQLEDALCQLCEFGDGSATARQAVLGSMGRQGAKGGKAEAPTTLPQVWFALQWLGLRDRRLEQLTEHARRTLVLPLLEAAMRLPKGRQLKHRIYTPTPGTSVWTWEDVPESGAETENFTPNRRALPSTKSNRWRPSVDVVTSALESLFIWAYANWAGSLSDVYMMLGRQLWPVVTQALLQEFETCDKDGGEALEKFELAMFNKGFIDGKDKTLSRHVHDHRHAIGQQRRASLLAEARSWLMSSDLCLVQVSDEDEPSYISQLLKQMGEAPVQPNSTTTTGNTLAPQAPSEFVQRKLGGVSTEDKGLLRLPTMHVSSSVHRLVDLVRSLTEETISAAEQGRHEAAADLNKLVRELCSLFSALRPVIHKKQLREDPRCCAIFLADCLYLVHVLLLMPYIYLARLAREQQHLTMFVDLVSQLRRLGENHFKTMLQQQKANLTAMLEPCDFAVELGKDRCFLAAEKALCLSMQQVKATAQGFASALPAQLLQQATGKVLGMVCQDLLGKVFRLHHAQPEDVGCMSMLLKSAVALGRQAYAAIGFSNTGSTNDLHLDRMRSDVPGWSSLLLVAELLGSSLPRFLEKQAVLLEVLRKDEVLTLLQLSLPGDGVSPQEAWAVLSGSST